MMPRYIVFIDQPYYPSVVGVYKTKALAYDALCKKRDEEHAPEGLHDSKLYLAEIELIAPIKTDY